MNFIEKTRLSERTIFWTVILLSIIVVAVIAGSLELNRVQDEQAKATLAAIPTMTAESLEFLYQKGLGYINIEHWQQAKTTLEFVFEIDPNYKDVQARLIEIETQMARLNITPTSLPLSGPPVATDTPIVSSNLTPSIPRQDMSQTLSCDNFDSGLDGWFVYSTYENPGIVVNPPGMMQLLGNSTRPSGVTVKKELSTTGQIEVTSVFTHFSPTTLYFWIEYIDGETYYLFRDGTTSSNPQVHIINDRTPVGKTPVALYFYAAVSEVFPAFRIDIDKVCVIQ